VLPKLKILGYFYKFPISKKVKYAKSNLIITTVDGVKFNMKKITEILGKVANIREIIIFSIMIGLVVIFYFTSFEHKFLSPEVLKTIFTVGPELGIITISVTLLMICGEFDLSVGSVMAVCGLIVVKLYTSGLNPFLALVIALGIGGAAGFMNGFITVRFRIPSFIVTLGMMMFWRGVVYTVTEGVTVRFNVIRTDPDFYNFFGGDVGGVPIGFIWFLIATVAFALILDHHRFGNHVYATGGNKEVARAMGVNTTRTKILCFILVGILAAFTGVMETTRIRGFYAQQGTGMELNTIAATVIGGTSLFGGSGTIIGTFLGVLVITFLEHGLIISRVSGYLFKLILGLLLVIVVIVNVLVEKRGKSR
jgi:simple sugar transport system permease protein